jgi:hypothetical protein
MVRCNALLDGAIVPGASIDYRHDIQSGRLIRFRFEMGDQNIPDRRGDNRRDLGPRYCSSWRAKHRCRSCQPGLVIDIGKDLLIMELHDILHLQHCLANDPRKANPLY